MKLPNRLTFISLNKDHVINSRNHGTSSRQRYVTLNLPLRNLTSAIFQNVVPERDR